MIRLECTVCDKVWAQPCEECAEESADKHTAATGHEPIRFAESFSRTLLSPIYRDIPRKKPKAKTRRNRGIA